MFIVRFSWSSMPNFCSTDATFQRVVNTQLLINNTHRILRGTQSSQLNGEPRNFFLRRDPKTDRCIINKQEADH
jgi:hypothetical protein